MMLGRLVESIVDATTEAFATMFMIEIECGEKTLGSSPKSYSGVSGVIGFAGNVTGAVGIHCSDDAAFRITSAITGMDMAEVNSTVIDTIGEVANIVAGGAKAKFSEEESQFQLSVPSVVIGKEHTVSPAIKAEWAVLSFNNPDFSFDVSVCVKGG